MRTDGRILAVVVGLLAGPVAAEPSVTLDDLMKIEGDAAWGEYLGSECTACHAEAGGRIPPIAGLPRDYMLEALLDYSTGARENATMEQIASALGADEMAALAAHFENAE